MAVLINHLSSSSSGAAPSLSTNTTSDELIDALDMALRRLMARADDFSLALVQAVRPALSALTRSRSTDRLSLISDQICRDFRLGPGQLRSKSREQRITFARHLAIFLCRRITGAPFQLIGGHFRRDHSSVIHAYQAIEQQARRNAAFRLFIEKLEKRISRTLSIGGA